MPVRFQVDPDFYDHPKALGMSDAATALWVRAGSYSAAKLLDGFVPEHVVRLLSQCPDEASDELVRRGLWRRTRGGFRFHQWGERNLTRERIEADRRADRERKRARRTSVTATRRVCDGCDDAFETTRNDQRYCSQRCRQAAYTRKRAGSDGKRPTGIRPESDRNPTGFRPLSVSVSASVSGSGREPSHDDGSPPEPPRRCPDHIGDPDPPRCGACAEARRRHDAWQADHARSEARRRSEAARQRAEARRAEVASCRLCDHDGRLPSGAVCTHDPARVGTASRGAAAVRAALGLPA